ncbi:hypothetical protein COO60DRAFT_414972 [Scenedesmus sp. NREL 46B-D3]|nr:hypothetical protein COO60DRAFT_414972 [Scenedesmus sp. NREL 46B-D3]
MHGDRTFTLFTAQADYTAASTICAGHGLQLASIHSAADNAALASLAAKDGKWSGGHIGGSMMLGLRYNASSYTWLDGTDVDWAPEGFDLTQPPPAAAVIGYSRHCVVVLSNGTWAPISCTRQPASFACQHTLTAAAAARECAPGFHLSAADTCSACPSGSWCEGGASPPVQCAEGLTTILVTASTPKENCVTKPGHGYVHDANATYGTVCPVSTFNTAGNKQGCSPCPGSLTTPSAGASDLASCGVPRGYFIPSNGTDVLPCPVGTYQDTVFAATQCTKCPTGSNTTATASTQAADCNVTLPGWYMSGSATNGTTNSNGSALIGFNSSTPMAYMFDRCPVNTYNNGGNLATACTACPYGTTTRFDPGMGHYWYYNVVDNTEDMCVPVAEHLPTVNVSTGGQSYEAYSTFSGSGTRYLWRWGAGPGSSDNGLLRTSLKEAELDCALLGGHLPSLHSLSQAEHLLGVHNSLWPPTLAGTPRLICGWASLRTWTGCTWSDEV